MTVCLAAICTVNNEEAIIGASDCMLTYENIEFEPPRSKIFSLNKRTFILYAGDVTDHTAIWRAAFLGKTTDDMTTTQIADKYAEAFQALRVKKAEARFLKPQGLTLKTYSSNQNRLSDYTVNDLRPKMEGSYLELEVIVAGLDDSGAHIFTIDDPGIAKCHDDISFCAVGMGAFHACSSYMFGRYTKLWDFGDCAYLTYHGKRRAEVAPGVGRETIMVDITKVHGARILDDSVVRLLKYQYEHASTEIQKIHNAAHENVKDWLAVRKLP